MRARPIIRCTPFGRLFSYSCAAVLAAAFLTTRSAAQDQLNQPLDARPNVAAGNGNGLGNGGNFGLGLPGPQGGAASADFDSLIDLITSTVEAESWEENGTGNGHIMPFAINGVYVDAAGALRLGPSRRPSTTLASVRAGGVKRPPPRGADVSGSSAKEAPSVAADARRPSPLRFVSLPRLEAAIADCQRRHVRLDPAMLALAGLQRVSHVLVYPETGDLVLAGPAGDWKPGPTGGIVSVAGERPIVRLDDLLALWRRQREEKSSAFGCSIVPREEALARTQQFLAASAAQPLEPRDRKAWLAKLRDTVGVQDVEYYNIDPASRIAGLMLAADYHMKLVGMGLAKGVPGVASYLSTVRLDANGQPPAMTVLRWWFSMPMAEVEASPEHDAFSLPGQCIKVLSENELLAERGQRVHTGQSEELNRRFADSFTREFAVLAEKYPVYAELERVFELALALALIEREGLVEKVSWQPSLLLDGERLRLPELPAPRAVETVINHRVIGGRHIVAGVSGGVWADGQESLSVSAAKSSSASALAGVRSAGQGQAEPLRWWWD